MQETRGSQYNLSLKKLWNSESIKNKSEDLRSVGATEHEKKLIKEGRTFFCSELVAKAFKVMGLIQTDKAAARYFPSSFTSNNDL